MKLVLYIAGKKVDEATIDYNDCAGHLDRRQRIIDIGNKLLHEHQEKIILNSYQWQIWMAIQIKEPVSCGIRTRIKAKHTVK